MGYLGPYVPEMKIKDYRTYQAFRFGIGTQLQAEYGFFARIWCQNDDMILLALLADGLSGREGTLRKRRDPLSLFRKREEISHTLGIRLAAQACVMMSCYAVETQYAMADTGWKRFKAGCKRRLLHAAHEKARQEAPILERMFLQVRDHAQALALARSADYEFAAQPMSNLFGALLAGCARDNGSTMSALRHMGNALGRITYLLHAIRNYSRDAATGSYNIFVQNGLDAKRAVESAQRQCNQAAAEIARAYRMLIFRFNRDIVENILFQGLERTVMQLEISAGEAAE